jgi:hypothetical protein
MDQQVAKAVQNLADSCQQQYDAERLPLGSLCFSSNELITLGGTLPPA